MKKQAIELLCNNPKWYDTRLDKFLSQQFADYSRSYFQEAISSGLVIVNNKAMTKSSYKIQENDRLNFPLKDLSYNLKPTPVDFDTIYKGDDFAIINKPAGLVVHHSLSNKDGITLVNGLLHRFDQLDSFKDKSRAGIVHRLDKDTSGLMIIALNPKAHESIKEMLKERKISKTYLAVTEGKPKTEGQIDLPVGRDPFAPHKMTTSGIYAKDALSLYKTTKYYDNYALVEVKIITGRTHQIRVHFSSIGHPVLGDIVYGQPSNKISRQALHSHKLEFDYDGKAYSFTSPLPKDIKKLLESE